MSKGWESKAVEEQMAARESAFLDGKTPKPTDARAYGDKLRMQQSLELQREQILNQRTSNAHRRVALAAALTQIEQQLEALGKEI